jgi:hypothetical protein
MSDYVTDVIEIIRKESYHLSMNNFIPNVILVSKGVYSILCQQAHCVGKPTTLFGMKIIVVEDADGCSVQITQLMNKKGFALMTVRL